MIQEAQRIDCPCIVLCPLNDASDPRTGQQHADELVAALNAYGPLFQAAGMIGLIEPARLRGPRPAHQAGSPGRQAQAPPTKTGSW
jgi:predicted xylose isomerase-like sugar epimerase